MNEQVIRDVERMLLIRVFEEKLLSLFAAGLVAGTTHTCLGQEYIPVALMDILQSADIFSNHRGHGHYLARFDDPTGLLAEILGRDQGVCRGVGGSQHLYRPGFMSTGVQGSALPVAAGVALHLKRRGDRRVAACFVGDGTWGEGIVYETLNIAVLWKLPLIIITENNGIAKSTPVTANMAGSISSRAQAFGADYALIHGCHVDDIRASLRDVISAVLDRGPLVIEFVTERLGPHSKGDDSRDVAWRERALASDWYLTYRVDQDPILQAAEKRQRQRVDVAVHKVLAMPLSSWGPQR